MLFGEFLSSRLEYPLLISFIFLFISSCSTSEILQTKKSTSRFLSVEKELMHVAPKEQNISNLQFSNRSKIIIWMHGTKRPAVAGNYNCTDDMPPESLTLAARKLNFSLYYLCSRAVDGREKGSFIYKRVDELEEKIKQLNQAGIKSENIFVSGFSAGGWTALMAARMLPTRFKGGVLFAPAFAGPRYETRIFPIWRKLIRPKQVSKILEAKRLNFLIFAYNDDPFNRPEDLYVFRRQGNSFPKITGYTCNRGHFTYKNDCKGKETYEEILSFFQASDS